MCGVATGRLDDVEVEDGVDDVEAEDGVDDVEAEDGTFREATTPELDALAGRTMATAK